MDAAYTADVTAPAPIEEPAVPMSPAEALERAKALPLDTRFELGATITPVQQAFLDLHGYLVFSQVMSPDEVQTLLSEAEAIQQTLIDDKVEKVNGLPVWFGSDPDGKPFVQRLAFTSTFSQFINDLVTDDRFEPVRTLIGEGARVGHREKDGVVLNRYVSCEGSVRPRLGWHTDGLRDVFYGRMPQRMLNVGLHMHRIAPEDGGLRLIPGTHNQGLLSTVFRKPYFISHGEDRNEIMVETWPGDLTVHDGRLWHRVAASSKTGWASYRCSMYVPYLTHDYDPKSSDSPTPIYMRVFDKAMKLVKWWRS